MKDQKISLAALIPPEEMVGVLRDMIVYNSPHLKQDADTVANNDDAVNHNVSFTLAGWITGEDPIESTHEESDEENTESTPESTSEVHAGPGNIVAHKPSADNSNENYSDRYNGDPDDFFEERKGTRDPISYDSDTKDSKTQDEDHRGSKESDMDYNDDYDDYDHENYEQEDQPNQEEDEEGDPYYNSYEDTDLMAEEKIISSSKFKDPGPISASNLRDYEPPKTEQAKEKSILKALSAAKAAGNHDIGGPQKIHSPFSFEGNRISHVKQHSSFRDMLQEKDTGPVRIVSSSSSFKNKDTVGNLDCVDKGEDLNGQRVAPNAPPESPNKRVQEKETLASKKQTITNVVRKPITAALMVPQIADKVAAKTKGKVVSTGKAVVKKGIKGAEKVKDKLDYLNEFTDKKPSLVLDTIEYVTDKADELLDIDEKEAFD